MMKRILIILVLSALATLGARAQDSLNLARMDSTYVGKSILSVILCHIEHLLSVFFC